MRYPVYILVSLIFPAACLCAADAPTPAATPAPASSPAPTSGKTTTTPATAAAPDAVVPVTAAIDLFNGKNLDGIAYVSASQMDIAKICEVKDGVLAVAGKPIGYLEFPGARADYQLHVEWRFTTQNRGNNGGVLINISPGPLQQNAWPVSIQVQTKPNRAGDIISMAGAKFAELPGSSPTQVDRKADSSEKPVGEWNTADITVKGDTITCLINGVLQNTVTKCVPGSGKIGMQLEGYPYELRNVRLAPLETAKPAAKP